MSISDKIVRLQNAKRAQAEALTEKGVNVPEGSGFENFPEMIRSIATTGGLPFDMGTFMLDSDRTGNFTTVIPHNLGKTPKFILVWTDDFEGLTGENMYSNGTHIGFVWFSNLTKLPQGVTSAISNTNGELVQFIIPPNGVHFSAVTGTSLSYFYYETTLPTDKGFSLISLGASYYWRAGIEYKYFVSEGFDNGNW